MASYLYSSVKVLLKVVTSMYFRKINVIGKENIPKELKSYDMILLDKKIEQYEEAKKRLDYWNNIINK